MGRVIIFDIDLSEFIDYDMIILFTEIIVFFSDLLLRFFFFLFNFFMRLFLRSFFLLLWLFLFMYFFLVKGIGMLRYFVPLFFGLNLLLFLDCLFDLVLDVIFLITCLLIRMIPLFSIRAHTIMSNDISHSSNELPKYTSENIYHNKFND